MADKDELITRLTTENEQLRRQLAEARNELREVYRSRVRYRLWALWMWWRHGATV